mgnify:CR=1 FL=1
MADKQEEKKTQEPASKKEDEKLPPVFLWLTTILGLFSTIASIYKTVPFLAVIALVITGGALFWHFIGSNLSKNVFTGIVIVLALISVGILLPFAQPGVTVQIYVELNNNATRQGHEPAASGGLVVILIDSNGVDREQTTNLEGVVTFNNVPSGAVDIRVENGTYSQRTVNFFQREFVVGITPTPLPPTPTLLSLSATSTETGTPLPPTLAVTPSETFLPTSTNTPTNSPFPSPTFTDTPSQTPTHIPPPPPTMTPSPPLPSATASEPAPPPTEEDTKTSEIDGMVQILIPAGEFQMGRDGGGDNPLHTVNLSTYWMDKTEVTNAMYTLCVSAGACTPPQTSNSSTRASYYGNTTYADFPVIEVSWHQANAYCTWAGRRLPTEAQWEKAGRGTDGRFRPWGNELPNRNRVNIGNYYGDTLAVTNYLADISFYEVRGMGGNVQEWVLDWYDSDYYSSSPKDNPVANSSSEIPATRVVRGGYWSGSAASSTGARLDARSRSTPNQQLDFIGFRCAENLP